MDHPIYVSKNSSLISFVFNFYLLSMKLPFPIPLNTSTKRSLLWCILFRVISISVGCLRSQVMSLCVHDCTFYPIPDRSHGVEKMTNEFTQKTRKRKDLIKGRVSKISYTNKLTRVIHVTWYFIKFTHKILIHLVCHDERYWSVREFPRPTNLS